MNDLLDLLREKVAICEQRHRRAVDKNARSVAAADHADRLLLEVLDAKLALARELAGPAVVVNVHVHGV
jgi:hypothetical protein